MKYLILIIGGLLVFTECQETSNKSEPATDSRAATAQKEKDNAPADTTYFALQTTMIQKAEVEKVALQKGDCYRVNVQLKDHYRDKYARAMEKSIGKFFALTYHSNILASGLPMINTKITSGRTTIGIFTSREQAEEIKRCILRKKNSH